ncbi:cbb3-type cytochrome oxidase subunit 3 [Tepidimonas sp.]
MDINDLRVIVTVISLVTFVGIWVWAWSRKNKARFDEAARLPFQSD